MNPPLRAPGHVCAKHTGQAASGTRVTVNDIDPTLQLRTALEAAFARDSGDAPWAVAVSGGVDSAMLAVLASHAAGNRPLYLFHVHHGLFGQADLWAEQVEQLGQALKLPVRVAHTVVDTTAGQGTEAAARQARYAALEKLAGELGVTTILLAHHLGDQAETVLLRLLRGTGPTGLAAMAAETRRNGIRYVRPWLEADRALIIDAARRYGDATGWRAATDPSNADPRYTRAAVRTLLAPSLDTRWPGWRAILARHARLTAQASVLLDEVARADFAKLDPSEDASSFSLAAWRELDAVHQAHVLRHWFDRNGLRMPTEARLEALVRQLRQLHQLGHDRQMLFDHAQARVRCVQGRVLLEPRPAGRSGGAGRRSPATR
ncbi:tRNA(Ile)-lysidine synthetase [plant metagenome]|uniref:tRNA(Ile)-lysidine synthetase n=1 Tax=plant metagenome TaxID=1297885 RepID=A0A484U139_9ZZZZ